MYVNVGRYGSVNESEKLFYRIGVGFNQKGSRKPPDPDNNDYTEYNLRLNYAEAHVQYDYLIKTGVAAQLGTSLGYLVSSYERNQAGNMNLNLPFKKLDWSASVSGALLLGPNFEVSVGYSSSIIKIRDQYASAIWYYRRGARNSLFFLRLSYRIPMKGEITNKVE